MGKKEKDLSVLRMTTPRRKWNVFGAIVGGLLGFSLGSLTGYHIVAMIGFFAFAYLGYNVKRTVPVAISTAKEFPGWFKQTWFYENVWENNPARFLSYFVFISVTILMFSGLSDYWEMQGITWSAAIGSGQFQHHFSACAYNYSWMLTYPNEIFAYFIFWFWWFCSACIGVCAAYGVVIIKFLLRETFSLIKESLTMENLNIAIRHIIAAITKAPIVTIRIILFFFYLLPVAIFQLLIQFIVTLHSHHRLACGIYTLIGGSGFLLMAPITGSFFLVSSLAIACGLFCGLVAHGLCLIEESAPCRKVSQKILNFQPKSIYPWELPAK